MLLEDFQKIKSLRNILYCKKTLINVLTSFYENKTEEEWEEEEEEEEEEDIDVDVGEEEMECVYV